jgi:hypothetical protein
MELRARARPLQNRPPASAPCHTTPLPWQEDWTALDKVGPKLAANVMASLRGSLQLPMAVALSGLGIP